MMKRPLHSGDVMRLILVSIRSIPVLSLQGQK